MRYRDLHTWLQSENKPFPKGVELYKKYSKNPYLLSLFAAETFVSRKHLLNALQKIADATNPVGSENNSHQTAKSQNHIPLTAAQVKRFAVKTEIDSLPKPLKTIAAEKNNLFAEAAELRRRLPTVNIAKRKTYIQRILEIFKRIDSIWFALDFYANTGEVLTKEDRTKNKATVLRELQNARSNVSRYKGTDKIKLYKKWENQRQKLQSIYDEFIQTGRYRFD